MRTTISIPDEVYSEARQIMGSRPFSEFASEAIHVRVQQLKRDRLAREMAEGYRVEAESSSLDSEWTELETEGL
jgi:predicted CopG family antitoxin